MRKMKKTLYVIFVQEHCDFFFMFRTLNLQIYCMQIYTPYTINKEFCFSYPISDSLIFKSFRNHAAKAVLFADKSFLLLVKTVAQQSHRCSFINCLKHVSRRDVRVQSIQVNALQEQAVKSWKNKLSNK